MAAVPPQSIADEAVFAAWAEAPEPRHLCYGGTETATVSRSDLRRMLEAAAPHIRADERARVQHAIDRVTQTAAAAQEKAVTAAVSAERDRLFVAIRHGIPLGKPWRGEALDAISTIWLDHP